jgi:hypothetical protein
MNHQAWRALEFLFVAHVASLRESHAFLDIESSDEPSSPFSRTAKFGLVYSQPLNVVRSEQFQKKHSTIDDSLDTG